MASIWAWSSTPSKTNRLSIAPEKYCPKVGLRPTSKKENELPGEPGTCVSTPST